MILNTKITKFIPSLQYNQSTIITPVKYLLSNLNFLKKHITYSLTSLQTIIGIDFINSKARFGIVYQLYSYTNKQHINVKVFFPLKKKIPSVVSIFLSAN
jgi:NADH:ubiquinone oxidoreductase subunit C